MLLDEHPRLDHSTRGCGAHHVIMLIRDWVPITQWMLVTRVCCSSVFCSGPFGLSVVCSERLLSSERLCCPGKHRASHGSTGLFLQSSHASSFFLYSPHGGRGGSGLPPTNDGVTLDATNVVTATVTPGLHVQQVHTHIKGGEEKPARRWQVFLQDLDRKNQCTLWERLVGLSQPVCLCPGSNKLWRAGYRGSAPVSQGISDNIRIQQSSTGPYRVSSVSPISGI